MNNSFDGDDWDDAPIAGSPLIPVEAEDEPNTGNTYLSPIGNPVTPPAYMAPASHTNSMVEDDDEGWGDDIPVASGLTSGLHGAPVEPVGDLKDVPLFSETSTVPDASQTVHPPIGEIDDSNPQFVEAPYTNTYPHNGNFGETSTPINNTDDEGWGDDEADLLSPQYPLEESYKNAWEETDNDEGWDDAPTAGVPAVPAAPSPIVNHPTIGDMLGSPSPVNPVFEEPALTQSGVVYSETGSKVEAPPELLDVVKPMAPINPIYLTQAEREELAAQQAAELQRVELAMMAEREALAAEEAANKLRAIEEAKAAAKAEAEANGEYFDKDFDDKFDDENTGNIILPQAVTPQVSPVTVTPTMATYSFEGENNEYDDEGWGDAPTAGTGVVNVVPGFAGEDIHAAGDPLPTQIVVDPATAHLEESLDVDDFDDEEELDEDSEGWDVLPETVSTGLGNVEQVHVNPAPPIVPQVAPEAAVTPPTVQPNVPPVIPAWNVDPASVIRDTSLDDEDEGWDDAPTAGTSVEDETDFENPVPEFDGPAAQEPAPVVAPRSTLLDAPELRRVNPGGLYPGTPVTQSWDPDPTPEPTREPAWEDTPVEPVTLPGQPLFPETYRAPNREIEDNTTTDETFDDEDDVFDEEEDEGWGDDTTFTPVPTVVPPVPTVVDAYPTTTNPAPSVIPPVPTVMNPVPTVIPPVPTVSLPGVPVPGSVDVDSVFTDKGTGREAGSPLAVQDVRNDSMPTHQPVVPEEPVIKLGSKIILPEPELDEEGNLLVNPKSSKSSPLVNVPAKPVRQVKRKSNAIGGIRLTGRDMKIMEFLARYRTATVGQLARRFETSETALRNRLPLLDKAGLIKWAWAAQTKPKVWMITAQGLKTVDMNLSAPEISWGQLRHTLGLVDIGIWFELRGESVLTEREIRAAAALNTPTERLKNAIDATRYRPDLEAFPIDGLDSVAVMERIKKALVIPVPGRPSGHWPDMILARQPFPNGMSGNIAVELELSRKGLDEWRKILTAFLNSPDFATVVYYVRTRDIQRSIQTVIRAIHAEEKIQVLIFEPIDQTANPNVNGG